MEPQSEPDPEAYTENIVEKGGICDGNGKWEAHVQSGLICRTSAARLRRSHIRGNGMSAGLRSELSKVANSSAKIVSARNRIIT